jgi:outer membrane protein TolC
MQARLDYIAVMREQENARVTGDLVRQTEERLRVSREEFEAGRAARFNVLRDEAELANAIQLDTLARSQAALALIALKTTLGVDLASPITASEPLQYVPEPVSVEEGVREGTAQHPEVRASETRAEAAQADVRAAYGRYLPDLSATWMYDWQRMNNRGEMTETPEGYSAGLVLTIPLFDGFMRENAIRTARARQDQAKEQAVLARQQIAKAVNQAALMLQAAEQNVEASRKGLAQGKNSSASCRAVRQRPGSGGGARRADRADSGALQRLAALPTSDCRAMWLQATGRVR